MAPVARPTSRFSLREPDDAGRSLLLVDGQSTGTRVRGSALRWQFSLPQGFVLITDYDDPWEEITEITLLDASMKTIGTASLGGGGTAFAHSTYQVKDLRWLDDRSFVTVPSAPEQGQYRVAISERALPVIGTRLKVTKY